MRKSLSPDQQLQNQIIQCERCPRLRHHCLAIAKEKRRAFLEWDYWGKPIPNFGFAPASLLIVGLAPAAHGANRTGRMFTGDRSGEWLYRALHKQGFANQAESSSIDDGLTLSNCLITAVAHCAPPDNKPTLDEIEMCRPFLIETLRLSGAKVILALGALAWNETLRVLKENFDGDIPRSCKFGHGAEYVVRKTPLLTLLGSYHPSQQNTFTGRLTEPMLDAVMKRARELSQ